MSKLTVVTGAAGFIGRNTVAELNARGERNLLLVDSLGTTDKWKNLVGLGFSDLISPEAFLRLLAETSPRIDAIIHLGACSSTTESNADFLLENNYRYSRTACEYALRHGARFIYASSAATYGDGARGYSDADDVTPALRPLNMYGYSKHLFDLWALREGHLAKIVGLKYFNVFGPFEDFKADMRSMAQRAYQQIKATGEVSLFKSARADYRDGQQARDFVYVKDAVDVTLHFWKHREKSGLLNCGTGKARTWNDLALAVFRALDLPPRIRYIDMPVGLRDRYQYFTQANVEKLRQAGYTRPFTELEDAVADYVRTHLEQ
jgi:ADP-L-glycero-D-manno-heptose 6-epimerase